MFNGNENITPSWFRARITAIRKLIEELPTSRDEKNPDRTLIRNGVIPEKLEKRFNEVHDYEYKLSFALNEPLTFSEITSFNTWFAMHPEKVCGKEVITTSREFPITIKGNKEEIIRTVKAGITQMPEQPTNSTQTEFQQDTKQIEVEQEDQANRFGSARKVLDWTVQDFHSYYHNAVNEFQQTQAPIEEQINELHQQVKDAGKDRTKRKELTAKLNDTIWQRNHNKNAFEGDWLNFCSELHNIILEIGKSKGLHIDEDSGWYIPDDIMLAFTDRPGIENYWHTKISEVIEKELQYFVKENEKQHKTADLLELEALALETELELLTI